MLPMHQRKETRKKLTSPTKRMTPMNLRKEMREKSNSPTMKKPKGTPHPRALTPHQRIVTAPAIKGNAPRPLSMTMGDEHGQRQIVSVSYPSSSTGGAQCVASSGGENNHNLRHTNRSRGNTSQGQHNQSRASNYANVANSVK